MKETTLSRFTPSLLSHAALEALLVQRLGRVAGHAAGLERVNLVKALEELRGGHGENVVEICRAALQEYLEAGEVDLATGAAEEWEARRTAQCCFAPVRSWKAMTSRGR
ncbi:MAG: hypothetical protein HZA54_07375 [Planctomycetes bacterium]|nr:hypothetical protein [Planctomycetota bacterium]